MADGSIEFSTTLDNSDLEAKLKEAEKKVDDLKKKIESKEAERNGLAEQMQAANDEIKRAMDSIEKLKARRAELLAGGEPSDSGKIAALTSEIDAELTAWEKQGAAVDKLQAKIDQVDGEIERYTERLNAAEGECVKLGNEAQRQAQKSDGAFKRAASGIKAAMASAAASIRERFSGVAKTTTNEFRVGFSGILGKFAALGVAAVGISKISGEMLKMAQQNKDFTAGVENLKAVMRGFLSSIVGAVLPAFTALVNTIAAIFERVGGLIDSIFGSNIVGSIQAQRDAASAAIQAENNEKSADYASKVAKAEEKQAKATKKLAKEQDKANKSVMGFDELNQLSADSSEDAADAMGDYADAVAAPDLATDWTQGFNPDFGILQGVLDWLDNLKNRILTDVEGPFARIRQGLQLIKKGWDELVLGITTGNWSLVWAGIRDIVLGALYVIEGAFNAFMDWLNEVTGGKFSKMFEGLKKTMSGVVEFIEGVLTGDWKKALKGLYNTADGILMAVEGAFDGLVNWLDEITGGKFHDIFEALKTTVSTSFGGIRKIMRGLTTFIDGVLSGDMTKALNGIKGIISGFAKTAKNLVTGIKNTAIRIVTQLFDWLSQKIPQLEPMFRLIKTAVNGTIKGIEKLINGAVKLVKKTISGLIDIVVGIFTGNKEKVLKGVKSIVNGIIDLLNGALGGFQDFLNWITGGVADIINGIAPDSNWSFKISIPSIPYLATGAVIPPNRKFLAVLGDQTSGRNLEAPESLIRQIVREEAGGADAIAIQQAFTAALMAVLPMLQQQDAGGDVTMVLQVGNEELARATNKGNAALARRGLITPELNMI